MLACPRNYRSPILDTVEPVREVGINVYHLSRRMGWKLVLELAERAENCRVTGLLVNRYPDGFFTASRTGKDCGKLLLDDSNYSASSSPQPLTTHHPRGWESIFTFGRRSPREKRDIVLSAEPWACDHHTLSGAWEGVDLFLAWKVPERE